MDADLDLTQVLEVEIQLVAHLIAHRAAKACSAGLCQSFKSRGQVHAVAVDVVALDDHVANAKYSSANFGGIG